MASFAAAQSTPDPIAQRVGLYGSMHLAARQARERYFDLLHDAPPFVIVAEARWIVAAVCSTLTEDGMVAACLLSFRLRDYAAAPERRA